MICYNQKSYCIRAVDHLLLGKAPGNSVGNFHMVKMQHSVSTIVVKAVEWHFIIDPEKHYHLVG